MQTITTPTLALGRAGRWEIRYSEKDQAGVWRSKTVSTRTSDRQDAERFLAGWQNAYQQALTNSPYTVGDLLDEYEKDSRTRGLSLTHRRKLDHLQSFFGSLPVEHLTQHTILQYSSQVRNQRTGQPLAPNSLRRSLGVLGAALRYAVKAGLITADKVPYIPMPPPVVGEARPLTVDQETRFLQLAAGTSVGEPRLTRVHRFAYLALCTGARKAAIQELQWPQVNLASGLIDFRNTQRTKKRRVVIPISDRLLPVLDLAYQQRINDSVLDDARDTRHEWDRLVKGTEFADFRIHDTRRTFATLAAQAGVSMWDIAGMLGDTVETVAKHYAQHSPDYLRDAVNRRTG